METFDSHGYTYRVGDRVRAFDPRTLGVVRYGRILKIGRKFAQLDFGLTGVRAVRFVDIIEPA
jgi:hypothetical protein